MLADGSSNVHMQYLREGILTNETDDNKLNQSSLIRVMREFLFTCIFIYVFHSFKIF